MSPHNEFQGIDDATPARHKLSRAVAVACIVLSANARAFQFETGNPDLEVRWDNSLRYNAMFRLEKADKELASSPLFDDATLSFSRGLVSNRLDLVSELDVIWNGQNGFRISGAAWYDSVYHDGSDHPATSFTWGSPSVRVGKFNQEAKDLHGSDVELLDALVFGTVQLGSTSLTARAGRHTLFWGQSLLTSGALHGVAGSMAPIDAAKAFSVPGAEVQELFMPTTKLSASWQVTPSLTFSGYYSFEFREHRLPAVGSYASTAEILPRKAEFAAIIPRPDLGLAAGLKRDGSEDEDEGEFGLGLEYYAGGLDADFGLYYLNYHDKLPSGLVAEINGLQAGGLIPPEMVGPVDAAVGRMKMTYKDDIDLFGLSASKELWGISFGADLVYRQDQPLAQDLEAALSGRIVLVPPGTRTEFDSFDASNYGGPTGDTLHFVANAFGFLNANALWQGGNYIVELTAARLEDINDAHKAFAAKHLVDSSGDADDSISTTLAVNFTPEWYQVFPSMDMKMPLSVSYGLANDAPIILGGTEDVGNFAIGLTFIYRQELQMDIKYSQALGSDSPSKDRDFVSLTAKYTF